jgi:hypothetical protein
MQTDIHAFSGIETHEPSVRASEDISCLRLRGHCIGDAGATYSNSSQEREVCENRCENLKSYEIPK